MYERVIPRSLAICETGTFLLRAARIRFFILATSAPDLLDRFPSLFSVVVAGEPNTFWAISAKVLRKIRSFFVSSMMYPRGSSAQGIKPLLSEIQYKSWHLRSNHCK